MLESAAQVIRGAGQFFTVLYCVAGGGKVGTGGVGVERELHATAKVLPCCRADIQLIAGVLIPAARQRLGKPGDFRVKAAVAEAADDFVVERHALLQIPGVEPGVALAGYGDDPILFQVVARLVRHGMANDPCLPGEVKYLVVMFAQIHFIQGEASGACLEGEENEQSEADPEADGVVPGKLRHKNPFLFL